MGLTACLVERTLRTMLDTTSTVTLTAALQAEVMTDEVRAYFRERIAPEVLERYSVRRQEPRGRPMAHCGGWRVHYRGEAYGKLFADSSDGRQEAEDCALCDAYLRSLDEAH